MKALYGSVIATLLAAAPIGSSFVTWPAWVERIGWTLVHSVWELAAVAVVVAIADAIARRRSAGTRYTVGAIGLGLMLLLPGLTWLCVTLSPSSNSTVDQPMIAETRPKVIASQIDVPEPEITSIVVGGLSKAAEPFHEHFPSPFNQVPEYVDREVPQESIPPVSVEFKTPDAVAIIVGEQSRITAKSGNDSPNLLARLHRAVKPWLP